jgi:folate-binding protein YgfZ
VNVHRSGHETVTERHGGASAAKFESPLLDLLVGAGAVIHEYHGVPTARHFGDPHGEYVAATESIAVFDRSHRTRLIVSGRAPGQMLDGVLTGKLPAAPAEAEERVVGGRATYHAVLTPKGKMVTDLDALLLGEEEAPGYLLDVPVAGRAGLLEHFQRYLPPRFARVTDASRGRAAISVVGPEGAAALSKLALGLRVDPEWLEAAEEGEWRAVGSPGEALVVARTGEVWPPAWTVHGPTAAVRSLWKAVVAEGARPAGLGVWSTLRVEAGRPVFGTEMDENTLPPEAGIVDRAIDQAKGCYTGQEVIVRIRDRGHVNRHLHRLELGDVPAPTKGTELLATDGSDKVVGEIRSAVQSPRAGTVLALAYVRRGVERVRLDDREIEVGARL